MESDLAKLTEHLVVSSFDFALLISNDGKHNCKVQNEFILGISDKDNSIKSDESWRFGCIDYGFPAEISKDSNGFNIAFFNAYQVFFSQHKALDWFAENEGYLSSNSQSTLHHSVNLKTDTTQQAYINNVERIKNYIRSGQIYELNYCLHHFANEATINPASVFIQLNELSLAPYTVFARIGGKYFICASPERFAKKVGNQISIQPMKGTARRGATKQEDKQIAQELQNNEKERAENIMIVDLTRNDLSKICVPGSVKVEQLCEVYSFSKVHQMVSTINGELIGEKSFDEIMKCIFPMGSMTGAPKVSATLIIDELESFTRGSFSGSFGYIKPNGDFDFNVLIRSIFYDAEKKEVFFATGGAITINSDPQKEWEELELKAENLKKALLN